MKKLLLLAALLAFATTALAGTNGGLGGAFGRIGAGARAKALGNAYTGLGAGTSAIYFNAGALPFLGGPQFAATTSRMALDRRLRLPRLRRAHQTQSRAGKARRKCGCGSRLAACRCG